MNIEIGVGIGSGLFAVTSSDRLIAYAWASTGNHSVSTSSVVHKTVNAVIGTNTASGVAPTVSNAKNANILSVTANVNGVALIPIVAIAGSISINAVVASSNSNGVVPAVSITRNVSVGGVVASSTTSAGVPTVSTGSGGTTYYLQMDGVDDVLYYNPNPATFTWDELIVDCVVTSKSAFDKYLSFNAGTNYLQRNGSNQDTWNAGNWTVYVDDVSVTNTTNFIPLNQRFTLRIVVGSAATNNNMDIFANNVSGSGATPGKLYSVTLKNTGNAVLIWDLTLGNAQDQSGNGRNGTLNGGTWVVA